ncbi:MAG: tetratricopeptide repeat protein [Myxococcales bacterium]|nr:tetratricopeptide repeat protein [Myxococcales bacterium]
MHRRRSDPAIRLSVVLTMALGAACVEPAARAQTPARTVTCGGLWGCAPAKEGERAETDTPRRSQYDRLLGSARRSLLSLRSTSINATTELIKDTTQQLRDAIQLLPDEPEAHSLLGQLYLERGHRVAAALALRHAEELYAHAGSSVVDTPLPAPPLEHVDPALALSLALLQAQEGDLSGALLRYQRLFDHAAHSPRLLYRMADVWMALGHLDDATALYERACAMPRGPDVPTVDIARACLGYIVALDRGERAIPAALWRKARTADRGPRAMDLLDFPSQGERDYHRALLFPVGCERRASLLRYLRDAAPDTPHSYIRRADSQLLRGRELSCPALP